MVERLVPHPVSMLCAQMLSSGTLLRVQASTKG